MLEPKQSEDSGETQSCKTKAGKHMNLAVRHVRRCRPRWTRPNVSSEGSVLLDGPGWGDGVPAVPGDTITTSPHLAKAFTSLLGEGVEQGKKDG